MAEKTEPRYCTIVVHHPRNDEFTEATKSKSLNYVLWNISEFNQHLSVIDINDTGDKVIITVQNDGDGNMHKILCTYNNSYYSLSYDDLQKVE
jgi:hypothetical protein